MARVAGVDLPRGKRIEIALTSIYGIGFSSSALILKNVEIDPSVRVFDLTKQHVKILSSYILAHNKIEGDLLRKVRGDIKRLIEIGSYRGSRHRSALPVRGQRTKTNARTRRGTRRTIGARNSKNVLKKR